MVELGIVLFVVALSVCVADWRKGLYVCLVVGFAQDPLRKLVPGEPVELTLLVAVFMAATLVGMRLKGVPLRFAPIHAWSGGLRTPLVLFVTLVLLQSAAAYLRTGSPIISGIGLLAYLSPLPAVLLGYHMSRTEGDVMRFMRVYVALSIVMASGIYLSYLGVESPLLGQVGKGLFAFAPTGEKLNLLSGFFRAPEIAAWHMATAVCMLILLILTSRQRVLFPWLAGLLILLLLGAILFTGRRKFLVEIALFIPLYGVLLAYFRRGAARLAVTMVVSVALAAGTFAYLLDDGVADSLAPYYERGLTVQDESADRFFRMTVGEFGFIVADNGVLGAGAGTGSQGAQHFGGGAALVGTAAEGGLGKVLAELGIPGLVLLVWLAVALARYVWRILLHVRRENATRARLAFALVALLCGNLALFSIAHQVFGDVFVLMILGWMVGFILAIPQLQLRSAPAPAPVLDRGLIPLRRPPGARLAHGLRV